MDTQLRRASGAELDLFYEWMRKQFHPGELKRLSHLHEMCARGPMLLTDSGAGRI